MQVILLVLMANITAINELIKFPFIVKAGSYYMNDLGEWV
jgi:hypothetical protein